MFVAASSCRFGLRRRALHGTVGTEDAALTLFGAEHLTTGRTDVERYTSVGRHGFFFFKTAVRTAQDRGKYHTALVMLAAPIAVHHELHELG